MHLVLYTTSKNGTGIRLQRLIESTDPQGQVETIVTVRGLERKLRQPVNGIAIAVLLAKNRKELLELVSIKDLFKDIRIILILPDGKSETTKIGHKLGPRFISYGYDDFSDVGAVLQKMVTYIQSTSFGLQQ